MALIQLGSIVAEIRGKLGGTVFSRNRSGNYMRNKTSPVNPNTERQVQVRSQFSFLAGYFKDTITATQRDNWNSWANNSPFTNVLGNTYYTTGINSFIKINMMKLLCGLSIIADPPTEFGEASPIILNEAGIVVSEAAGTISITAITDLLNFDGSIDDEAVLISVGEPRSPNVNFFKGPYKIATAIVGNSLTPPVFPNEITPPYALIEGQRLNIKVKHLSATGQVSPESVCDVLVVA